MVAKRKAKVKAKGKKGSGKIQARTKVKKTPAAPPPVVAEPAEEMLGYGVIEAEFEDEAPAETPQDEPPSE